MKKNKYYLLFCLLLPLMQQAQTVAVEKAEMIKVFQKMNDWFKNTPSYSMNVTHASYENYDAQVPAEQATGYFKKENGNYHSFLLGMHTIQNEHYKFVLDTSSKVMLVANPDQLTWTTYTTDDYMSLLKSSTALKMTKVGTYTFYRIELPSTAPIGAYEFLVDAEGLLKEVKWYYNQEVKKIDGDENSKIKPKASISFSNYKKELAFNYKDVFSELPYFTSVTNKLRTTSHYSGYKLLDQRIRY